jgi:hypothetical protein
MLAENYNGYNMMITVFQAEYTYSSALKIQAADSTEVSVNNTLHHISESSSLYYWDV